MHRLESKTALVTGSTQGLGLAIAEKLAGAGCNVVLNGLAEPERIVELQRAIEDRSGCRVLYCGADLRRPGEIEQMVQTAAATFGTVDILVNNAVVRHAAPVEQFAPADWDEALAVNLSAAFHSIRVALPLMRSAGWGRIVNISSIYGLRGAANRIGYVTTKTALIGLTRGVALETAGENITCNAVCPGTSRTPIHEAAVERLMAGTALADAERQLLAGKQPTGRLIPPEHVAALVAFLCGPDAADITGAALPIDGAWSAA
jgi:3-hydroxybutyrate dehydrogenase